MTIFEYVVVGLLVIIAALLTFTTSPAQLAHGLEAALGPLARVGLPVRELVMVLTRDHDPAFIGALAGRDRRIDCDDHTGQIVRWRAAGIFDLLPAQTLRALEAVESRARKVLIRSGFKTVWGTFVPVTSYREFRQEMDLCRDDYFALRDEIEGALGARGIFANVDTITGLLYHPMGLPVSAFPIPFCLAIQTGWMAHCLEYLPDGKVIASLKVTPLASEGPLLVTVSV